MVKSRAEQIKEMDIDALSNWVYDNFVFDCGECPAKEQCDKLPDADETECTDLIKDWLNETEKPTLSVGDILELSTDTYGVVSSWVVASDSNLYSTDGRYKCIETSDLDYSKIRAIYSVKPDEEPKLIWERN